MAASQIQIEALQAQMAQMSAALQALTGAKVAAAPPPPQREWYPSVAPPAPAPPLIREPILYRPPPPDYKRAMANVLGRFKPHSISLVTNWRLLQFIFRNHQEDFEITSEAHNSPDGRQTYFSARATLESWLHLNIHFFGTLRGSMFKVNRIEVYNADKTTWLTCDFIRDEDDGGSRSVTSADY
jgi:hypothetical protein